MKTLKLLLILIETDPVFLASKCGIQNACAPTPTSLGPEDMDDRRLSSISAAVDWAKTNNLLGVFLDADLLVSDALCPSPLSYLLFCPLALIIKTFFFLSFWYLFSLSLPHSPSHSVSLSLHHPFPFFFYFLHGLTQCKLTRAPYLSLSFFCILSLVYSNSNSNSILPLGKSPFIDARRKGHGTPSRGLRIK